MESLLNRYRNITILLLVIFAQLILLGYQVKNREDVRVIRSWTVSAVTPMARALEAVRSGTAGVLQNYISLRNTQSENQRMQQELGKLKIENQFLKAELMTADRAKALAAFQSRTPSRTIAARVIGTGATSGSKLVFLDRGSSAGVERGMGVVTPDGIVGKVIAAYPMASEVLLITDSDFAAGVISQKSEVKGVLKGQGYATCKVDYIQNEQKVQVGEWFYTSGDDRVFPKGFPVGVVQVVRPGTPFKEVFVEPSGLEHGLEEVLILVESVNQIIPQAPPANTPIYMSPAPPQSADVAASDHGSAQTEADRLREHYQAVGDAQHHVFGEGLPGSKPPDFNLKVSAAPATGGETKAAPPPKAPAAVNGAAPAARPAAKPAAPPSPRPPVSPSQTPGVGQ